MTPNWLRVDRAIIFFRSHSNIALIPAISMVRVLIRKTYLLNHWREDKKG